MTALFSTPKIPALPPAPEPAGEQVARAGERQRRRLLRGTVPTILTSGQGLTNNIQVKRSLLGGS